LRGTIAVGHTQGVHLLATYQAEPGLIRAQVAVDAKANEIVATPTVVEKLDLTGVVITRDALVPKARLPSADDCLRPINDLQLDYRTQDRRW
jgi:hypothetical protein